MTSPLEGYVVIDLSSGIAGGYCTKTLADGGAAGDKPPEGFLNFAPINILMSRDGGDIGMCMFPATMRD